MNTSEGLRRTATVFRVLGWLGTTFVGVGFALIVSPADLDQANFVAFVVMAGAPVAIAYGVAWIIDGFATPREK